MTPAGVDDHVVPVFFLSDSTGISAEIMGNALLIQFPDVRFERQLFPFITTVEEAQARGADPRRGHGRAGHAAGVRHGGRGRHPVRARQDDARR